MAKIEAALARVREICLWLPDTNETMTWGKPHFRVGEKIFAGYGEEDGKPAIGRILESYRLIAPKKTLAKLEKPASRTRKPR